MSIAVIKQPIGTQSRTPSALLTATPLGVISDAFTENLLARLSHGSMAGGQFPLEYLSEEQTPVWTPAPSYDIHLDFNVNVSGDVLPERLITRERVERVLERLVTERVRTVETERGVPGRRMSGAARDKSQQARVNLTDISVRERIRRGSAPVPGTAARRIVSYAGTDFVRRDGAAAFRMQGVDGRAGAQTGQSVHAGTAPAERLFPSSQGYARPIALRDAASQPVAGPRRSVGAVSASRAGVMQTARVTETEPANATRSGVKRWVSPAMIPGRAPERVWSAGDADGAVVSVSGEAARQSLNTASNGGVGIQDHFGGASDATGGAGTPPVIDSSGTSEAYRPVEIAFGGDAADAAMRHVSVDAGGAADESIFRRVLRRIAARFSGTADGSNTARPADAAAESMPGEDTTRRPSRILKRQPGERPARVVTTNADAGRGRTSAQSARPEVGAARSPTTARHVPDGSRKDSIHDIADAAQHPTERLAVAARQENGYAPASPEHGETSEYLRAGADTVVPGERNDALARHDGIGAPVPLERRETQAWREADADTAITREQTIVSARQSGVHAPVQLEHRDPQDAPPSGAAGERPFENVRQSDAHTPVSLEYRDPLDAPPELGEPLAQSQSGAISERPSANVRQSDAHTPVSPERRDPLDAPQERGGTTARSIAGAAAERPIASAMPNDAPTPVLLEHRDPADTSPEREETVDQLQTGNIVERSSILARPNGAQTPVSLEYRDPLDATPERGETVERIQTGNIVERPSVFARPNAAHTPVSLEYRNPLDAMPMPGETAAATHAGASEGRPPISVRRSLFHTPLSFGYRSLLSAPPMRGTPSARTQAGADGASSVSELQNAVRTPVLLEHRDPPNMSPEDGEPLVGPRAGEAERQRPLSARRSPFLAPLSLGYRSAPNAPAERGEPSAMPRTGTGGERYTASARPGGIRTLIPREGGAAHVMHAPETGERAGGHARSLRISRQLPKVTAADGHAHGDMPPLTGADNPAILEHPAASAPFASLARPMGRAARLGRFLEHPSTDSGDGTERMPFEARRAGSHAIRPRAGAISTITGMPVASRRVRAGQAVPGRDAAARGTALAPGSLEYAFPGLMDASGERLPLPDRRTLGAADEKMPAWARDFFSETSAAQPRAVEGAAAMRTSPERSRVSSASKWTAQGAPSARQVEWTAPGYASSARMEHKEKEATPPPRPARISDAEIHRLASRVYTVLEERIARESRRLGR